MSKILITGGSKLDAIEDYWQQQQLKVVVCHYSLVHGLRDAGHTVEHRPVEFGENLDHFDKVIVFLSPMGFQPPYLYESLWCLAERPDAIVAFSDWQVKQILTGVFGLAWDLWRRYEGTDAYKWESQLTAAIAAVRRGQHAALVPTFAGGDLTLLYPEWKGEWHRWNPNPYHLNKVPSNGICRALDKQRVWNFVSLTQPCKFIADWPIELIGRRAKGQRRMPEQELIDEVYNPYWGTLMGKYYHSGAGWWRCRVKQVIDCRSILFTELTEHKILFGEPHQLPIEMIEGLTTTQLALLANARQAAFEDIHPMSKVVFHDELAGTPLYTEGRQA